MLSKSLQILVCSAIVLAAGVHAQDNAQRNALAKQVSSKANRLRPSDESLKWRQIPWMTNLAEGLKVAQQEGRPVFLWGSDDEPLERC
jgi:hypothetical protein